MTGFLGAALANRIGWESAPALPAGADRDRLAELFTPGMRADWYASTTAFTNNGGETDAASIEYGTGRTAETEDVADYMAGLTQRLTAAGWTVIDTWSTSPTDIDTGVPQNNSQALTATNGTLMLSFEDYFDAGYDEGGLTVMVYRAEPGWLSATTIAAGLLAAAAGWLITSWARRRLRGRPTRTLVAGAAAGAAVILLTPAWAMGSLSFIGTLTGDALQDAPFWRGLSPADEFGGLAVPAAIALIVALTAALLPGPRGARLPVAGDAASRLK